MNHPIIKIHVKNFGTMTAELYPEKSGEIAAADGGKLCLAL